MNGKRRYKTGRFRTLGSGARNPRYRKANNNYAYSTRPQRMGPGQLVKVINTEVALPGGGTDLRLGTLMNTNELNTIRYDFRFMKILNVGIIFEPQNTTEDTLSYRKVLIQVRWDGVSPQGSIEYDDDTKIVAGYRTRRKVFTYTPPNMVTRLTTSGNPLNYQDFLPTNIDILQLPGVIRVENQTAAAVQIRVAFNVLFRGSQTLPPSSKIEILKQLDEPKKTEFKVIDTMQKLNALKIQPDTNKD